MAMTAVAASGMNRLGRLHMNHISDDEEDPSLLHGISYPGRHDVMLGRGGESTYHCGNVAFRQLVEDHKNKYYLAPRAHKGRVVAEVVRKWRQLSPPGRFLTRTNPVDGDKSAWHDVGDRRALKKASHSLRDAVRCFTIEKKQREKEQKEGRLNFDDAEEDEDEEDALVPLTLSSSTEGRKRGRDLEEPEYTPSFSSTKGQSIARHQAWDASEYISVSVVQRKKASLAIFPEVQERPAKMRRVVCDEREEAQDDCRREGCDDDFSSCRGDEGRCGERESCARDDDSGRQPSFVPSSVKVHHLLASARNMCCTPPQAFFTERQKERLDGTASPCGSADWFTASTADLPVRAAPSYSLPTADVLVLEVSHNNKTADSNGFMFGNFSDDESLGWFSENEDDTPSEFFTGGDPTFHVSFHKPLASRKNARASSGREL